MARGALIERLYTAEEAVGMAMRAEAEEMRLVARLEHDELDAPDRLDIEGRLVVARAGRRHCGLIVEQGLLELELIAAKMTR